jgi:hypothetical protein
LFDASVLLGGQLNHSSASLEVSVVISAKSDLNCGVGGPASDCVGSITVKLANFLFADGLVEISIHDQVG